MAWRPNKPFYTIINDLGLSQGLQICLDAGDAASYTSGQTWGNLGSSAGFFLGATSGAAADDPTFVGVAGDVKDTTYFSFDGGDMFRYSAANTAWMDSIHKAGAKYTFAAWIYFGSLAGLQNICGDRGAAGGTGFYFYVGNDGSVNLIVQNAGVDAKNTGTAAGFAVASAWQFCTLTFDETIGASGATFSVNGVTSQVSSTYTSPASGAASFTLEIGARGNSDTLLPNLSRIGFFGVWNRKLSDAEIQLLYAYPAMVYSGAGTVMNIREVQGY